MEQDGYTNKIEILLVDDRPENLLSLEAVLDCPEYRLIKTGSGDEALRYLLSHTPALILMDVQMPGLNGFDTAAMIRGSERTREIPIIFITAISASERLVHEAYEHGAVDYIYKPYDAAVLKSKVAVFAEIMRQHAHTARLVAVQTATTRALADSGEVGEAVLKVLKSICQSLGWDLGNFWRIDRKSEELVCQGEWHDPDLNAPEFINECFKSRLRLGVGIPGRVWATRNPVWTAELSVEPASRSLTLACREGLATGVAVPIRVQNEMMGVLEFFSRGQQTADAHLVRILDAIGSQIGQVLRTSEALNSAQASEGHKTAILDSALDCIVSMDQRGRITAFNPAAEAVFGYSRAKAIGRPLSDIAIPRTGGGAPVAGLTEILSGKESPLLEQRVEIEGLRADGTMFPMEVAVTRLPYTEPPLFTAFLRDITQRRSIEENAAFLSEATAALSSSLDFEATFEVLARLATRKLADWCAIHVSESAGAPRAVAVAHRDPARAEHCQQFSEQFPTDWGAPVGAAHVLATGRAELYASINEDLLAKGAQNGEHLNALRAFGLKSAMFVPLTARGKILGVITLLSSESGRRYTTDDLAVAEELARRAAIAIDNARHYKDAQEAIRIRDEFFSIASHEFKTPITSLKLQLQLALRGMKSLDARGPATEKAERMLSLSERQVDQLNHLVEDLLDVVKIRAGKLDIQKEQVDLSGLVSELAEQHSGSFVAARCVLELAIEPGISGPCDRRRIEQVLVNLISNAIKYAPAAPVRIEVKRCAGTVEISVRDRGPGIAPEQQSKIFDRFERVAHSRSVQGLGLGLFIVKQIVEAHGGTIRIESRQGEGSNFIVGLPLQVLEGKSWIKATAAALREGA